MQPMPPVMSPLRSATSRVLCFAWLSCVLCIASGALAQTDAPEARRRIRAAPRSPPLQPWFQPATFNSRQVCLARLIRGSSPHATD